LAFPSTFKSQLQKATSKSNFKNKFQKSISKISRNVISSDFYKIATAFL